MRRELFVSNTSTEAECPSKVKTLGMLLEEVDRLTVEGNGATLVFHGKITPIALIRCRDVELRNLHIDFERPGGSEMTYVGSDSTGVEVVFHPDTRYAVVDGRIVLYGEGWRSEHNHCIEFDPAADRFFYSEGWSRLSDAPAAEQGARRVRFMLGQSYGFEAFSRGDTAAFVRAETRSASPGRRSPRSAS